MFYSRLIIILLVVCIFLTCIGGYFAMEWFINIAKKSLKRFVIYIRSKNIKNIIKRNGNADAWSLFKMAFIIIAILILILVFRFSFLKTLVSRGDEEYTDYSYLVENVYKEGIFDYRVICTTYDGTDKYSTIEAKIPKKLHDRLSAGDIITVTYVKTYIDNTTRTNKHLLQTNFIIEGEWVDYNNVKDVYYS